MKSGPLLLGLAARLRFPWLFALTTGLFLLDLLVPDPLPFFDELFLGLVALLFAAWRKRDRKTHERPGRMPG